MPNVVFPDSALQSEFNSVLKTKLETRSLMNIDRTLESVPGMKKTFNRYTYVGSAESVAQGAGVVTQSSISYSPVTYTMETYQQEFPYYQEEVDQDGAFLGFAIKGAAETMVNRVNDAFFAELQKATLELPYANGGAVTYDNFVDAIQLMNVEDENNVVIVIGTDLKADIRKDADFTSSRQGDILYTGQIGFIAGRPLIVSKSVPAGCAYVFDKAAITLFLKRDSDVGTQPDRITRKTTLVMNQVALVALVDATKVVAVLQYVSTPVITTAAIAPGANKAFAGTCQAGSTIEILKNGAGTGLYGVVVADAWTYTIPLAVAAEVYSVRASQANFATKDAAAGITVA